MIRSIDRSDLIALALIPAVALTLASCDSIPIFDLGSDIDLSKPLTVGEVSGDIRLLTAEGTEQPLEPGMALQSSHGLLMGVGSRLVIQIDGHPYFSIERADQASGSTGRQLLPALLSEHTNTIPEDCFVGVARVQGTAEVKLPGSDEWTGVQPGQELPPGTVIATGMDSQVVVSVTCENSNFDGLYRVTSLVQGQLRKKLEDTSTEKAAKFNDEVKVHIMVEDVSTSFRVATPHLITSIKG